MDFIDEQNPAARRAAPRWSLPAPYTSVKVRVGDRPRFDRTGHVYDLSAGGVMFELDEPIAPGERVELKLRLPGRRDSRGRKGDAGDRPAAADAGEILVSGRIVRLLDADQPGPARMAAMFFQFDTPTVAARLRQYLAAA